jgi:hypothetical protein
MHCVVTVSYSPNIFTVHRHISSSLAVTCTNPAFPLIRLTPTSGFPPGDIFSGPSMRLRNVRRGTCHEHAAQLAGADAAGWDGELESEEGGAESAGWE